MTTELQQTLQQELADELAKAKDLTGNLETVNADLSEVTGQLASINTALASAASALKLDLKADASPVETIAAMQKAAINTLARLGVSIADIPDRTNAKVELTGRKRAIAAFKIVEG